MTGLKAHWWRYWTKSALVLISYALQANGVKCLGGDRRGLRDIYVIESSAGVSFTSDGGAGIAQLDCLYCFRCPFTVARDLGRCLRTSSDVRPGQVAKNPASMALVQVCTTGLKAHRWR